MFSNYLAAALRNLARNRVHGTITILSLALGFTAVILTAVYWRYENTYDRFWDGGKRIYALAEHYVQTSGYEGTNPQTPLNAGEVVAGTYPAEIEAYTRFASQDMFMKNGQVQAAEGGVLMVDAHFLDVLPFRAVRGDPKAALAQPNTLVLTQSLARKYFGDADPVGKTLIAADVYSFGVSLEKLGESAPPGARPVRIGAVVEDLPRQSHLNVRAFMSARFIAFPTHPEAGSSFEVEEFETPVGSVYTYLRLKPGASVQTIRSGLPALSARHLVPEPTYQKSVSLYIAPIADLHLPPANGEGGDVVLGGMGESAFRPSMARPILIALSALAGLVLLTAAINFITLMTARGAGRALEVGVRKAVGARRLDLVGQFIGEAVLYAAIALIVAFAFAELLTPAANAFAGADMHIDYLGDWRLTLGITGAALVTGLLAGVYPAFALSAYRPAAVLKGGLVRTPGSAILRQILVVLQFLPVLLLGFASVGIHQEVGHIINRAVEAVDENALLLGETCNARNQERLHAIPGVTRVGCLPVSSFGMNGEMMANPEGFGQQAMAINRSNQPVKIESSGVTTGTIAFYRYKLLAGRLLSEDHGPDTVAIREQAPRMKTNGPPGQEHTWVDSSVPIAEWVANPSVLLNETAVRRLGLGTPAQAVGKTLVWDHPSDHSSSDPDPHAKRFPSTIVGVVANRQGNMGSVGPKLFYLDVAQGDGIGVDISGRDAQAVVADIEKAWKAAGEYQPVSRAFYRDAVSVMYDALTRPMQIVLFCVILSLLIAAMGMYSLSAFMAERRTKEIGIRRAVGAPRGRVIWMLLRQFVRPVIIANLITGPIAGVAAFLALSSVEPGDRANVGLLVFAPVIAGSLLIAVVVTFAHAWQVASADPVKSLRYE